MKTIRYCYFVYGDAKKTQSLMTVYAKNIKEARSLAFSFVGNREVWFTKWAYSKKSND